MDMSAQLMCFSSPEEYPALIEAYDKICGELEKAEEKGKTTFIDSWTADGLKYQIIMNFESDGMYSFTANAQ